MGTPFPLTKTGRSSQFSTHVYCCQAAGWIKMVLGTKVGLSPGDFVLDGHPAPSPKKGAEPPLQFSAHFYCCQTAGCIKMPLGMDVDPVPLPKKGAEHSPKFSAHVYCGQTAGWIKMVLGTKVGLSPGDFTLHGGPFPLPKNGGGAPQIFGPYLLWPNG